MNSHPSYPGVRRLLATGRPGPAGGGRTVGGVSGAYFDAAAGSPPHPAAVAALAGALADGWADPNKLYGAGRRARLLLEDARAGIADVLGARADEVRFCGSGTEAAHLAVLGGLAARRRHGSTLVHSAVEHSCVLHAAERHVAAGGRAVSVPVDRLGRVDVAAYDRALDGAALASLMTANHEVGTLQPVAEVAAACRARGVPLHTDAAQSAGRLPVPPGWSFLTASAHKWGGPPGVGVLAVRTGTRWRDPRPADDRGFDNVPAAVAAAAALRATAAEAGAENARLRALVDRVRAAAGAIEDVEVVGDPDQGLPHLVTFSCLYVDGETLLRDLDRLGFAVSSGSSCTSSTLTPSHVLEAMGVLTHGNVRVSLHRDTTAAEVDRFLAVLPGLVRDQRTAAGL
jgi:cysteine desulfurase